MTVLPILIAPDPRLKRPALPVGRIDADAVRLMDDLLETMYAANGIGLAAPQVDVARRIIVVDVAEQDGPRRPLCLADPAVIWASEDTAIYNEGCLSFPDLYADVERPRAVRVRYLDRGGKNQEMAAEGLLATCLQHEIDHLNGILFIDHISKLKRDIILRKMQKAKKLIAAD